MLHTGDEALRLTNSTSVWATAVVSTGQDTLPDQISCLGFILERSACQPEMGRIVFISPEIHLSSRIFAMGASVYP